MEKRNDIFFRKMIKTRSDYNDKNIKSYLLFEMKKKEKDIHI